MILISEYYTNRLLSRRFIRFWPLERKKNLLRALQHPGNVSNRITETFARDPIAVFITFTFQLKIKTEISKKSIRWATPRRAYALPGIPTCQAPCIVRETWRRVTIFLQPLQTRSKRCSECIICPIAFHSM